jgi:protein-S-isoprenylcysteine O-methyltransferase Ste14
MFAKPLAYTTPYAWFFWIAFLLAFVPEFGLISRSRTAKGENTDRGSTAVIVLAAWVGMFSAFAVAGMPLFVVHRGQKVWFVLGLVILLSGSAIRRHCWSVLGQYFTGNVRTVVDQPLIQNGVYRWVRHPSYTGGMLMYLGTGLALTNWLSVVLVTVPALAAYIYRVRVEEQALLASLGQPYEEYMRRTKRFVPFVI